MMVIRGSRFPGMLCAGGAAVKISDAFEHSAHDERQGHGRVVEYFGKLPAFIRRNEFPPRHSLGVGAARQPSPMDGLRTDANAIVVTLERHFFVSAPRQQFREHPKLLRPVSRYAATDGEYSHAFGRQH